MSHAEGYLVLGLRLGKHVDGLVDAYYGPAELQQQVDAEGTIEAAELAADADALLAEVGDSWLGDQVRGCATYAHRLAGDEIPYADEVEGCYGVRPTATPVSVYEAVHTELDELLPGDGSLYERRQAFRNGQLVDGAVATGALRELLPLLRERTAAIVELPDGERPVLEPVNDEPWWAFNYYLGGLRSRVVVNLDVPTTCHEVVHLAAHEIYPGHHTDHAVKEQLLIRDRGLIEESIQMVPTPAPLLQEGIAELGPSIVRDDDLQARLVAALGRHGLDYDAVRSEAIAEARRALRRVTVDAALMIHEHGVSVEEAVAYVQRWSLSTAEEAAHSVGFVIDPTWRAYTITYSAGRELCEAWVGGEPARFVRLLTEQVRVADLLEAKPDGH